MYAIKNTKTNKWVCGTNFRRYPSYQLTSNEQALTWEHEGDAKMEFRRRRCSKDYKIVKVKLEEESEMSAEEKFQYAYHAITGD